VGKIAEKAVCWSVCLTTGHYILSVENALLQTVFWRFYPLGYDRLYRIFFTLKFDLHLTLFY